MADSDDPTSWENQKRTPAGWARECLSLLRLVHPEYERNQHAKGRFIEFRRPLSCGALVSQSFVRNRDQYYLCFAVLLGEPVGEFLVSPLIAGSRFDTNRTIWAQFAQDLGLHRTHDDPTTRGPDGIWSFGAWRRNTMDLLKTGLRRPEEYLLPHYLQKLREGSARLTDFYRTALEVLPALWKAKDEQEDRPSDWAVGLAATHPWSDGNPHVIVRLAKELDTARAAGIDVEALFSVQDFYSLGALNLARGAAPKKVRATCEDDLSAVPLEVLVALEHEKLPRDPAALRAILGTIERLAVGQ